MKTRLAELKRVALLLDEAGILAECGMHWAADIKIQEAKAILFPSVANPPGRRWREAVTPADAARPSLGA